MQQSVERRFNISILLAIFLFASFTVEALEVDYKQLYQRSSKAVVLLYGTDGVNGARGTGSIISKEGLVLTNTHVVSKNAKYGQNSMHF